MTARPPREDDPSIRDGCRLLRRISPEWIVPDGDSGRFRISSQGFTHEELSVNIEDDLLEQGHRPEDALEKYPQFGLAAITAGLARSHDQAVCRDDVPGELCHGLIVGKKTRAVQRTLSREATDNIIVAPPR